MVMNSYIKTGSIEPVAAPCGWENPAPAAPQELTVEAPGQDAQTLKARIVAGVKGCVSNVAGNFADDVALGIIVAVATDGTMVGQFEAEKVGYDCVKGAILATGATIHSGAPVTNLALDRSTPMGRHTATRGFPLASSKTARPKER
jgi:hypothetical protein